MIEALSDEDEFVIEWYKDFYVNDWFLGHVDNPGRGITKEIRIDYFMLMAFIEHLTKGDINYSKDVEILKWMLDMLHYYDFYYWSEGE